MKNKGTKLDIITNILTISVILLLGYVLINKFILNDKAVPKSSEANSLIGKQIDIPNINWSKNSQTLLIVLSTTCHFCTENVPFYQKLAQQFNKKEELKLMAVFPQQQSVAKDYLSNNKIAINDIFQIVPSEIGVKGTPTILLLDNEGKVIQAWLGKIPASEEEKIIKEINSKTNLI